MTGWAKVKGAAKYAGVSERTLRSWLSAGLRHSRLPSGLVLVSYQAIDEFIGKFEHQRDAVDQIVEETVRELR